MARVVFVAPHRALTCLPQMIAYNICFSTCLGRLEHNTVGVMPKLGVKAYAPPAGCTAQHQRDVYVSPNGVMFMPSNRRRGVLPRMLQEILDTRYVALCTCHSLPCRHRDRLFTSRIMVKESMKRPDVKSDPVLTRIMHARQLALKLLANVTYGYTSAGYSGRMPCAEIADAIVQSVRTA